MKESKNRRRFEILSPHAASVVVALAVAGVVTPAARAADIAYSLTPADATFSGLNWTPGAVPTSPPTQSAGLTDFLYLGGAPAIASVPVTALNNDLTGATFTGITYDADAVAFTINGNVFTLGGNLTNNSAAAQTIKPAITLDAVRTVTTTSSTGTVTLFGAITGTGGLIKEGTGTLILNAGGGIAATPVSTYSGGTIVNAGSIIAQRTGQTALGTGPVTVANGANVTITDHTGGTVTTYANDFKLTGSGTDGTGALKFFNSGLFSMTGAINISGGTVIGTDPNTQNGTNGANGIVTYNPVGTGGIHGSGGLTLAGLQGQTLNATSGSSGFTLTRATGGAGNDYTGDTRITSAGKNANSPFNITLAGNTSNRLPSTTTLIFGGAYSGAPVGLSFDKSVTLTLGAAAASQTVAGLITDNTPAAGQTYRIVSSATGNVGLTVNNAVTNTFNGVIGGTGTNNNNVALAKNGVGVLILGGANTNTSGTTINAGTLSVTGSLADTGAVTVAGGTYDVAASDTVGAVTLTSGTISGVGTLTATSYAVNIAAANTVALTLAGGTLTKSGVGTLTLSGNNTYGSTAVNAGTLAVGAGGTTGALGTGAVTMSNSSNLSFNRSDTSVVSNVISGVGSVTQNGTGITNLTGANTYTGVTTIATGSIKANSDAYAHNLSAPAAANHSDVDLTSSAAKLLLDYTGGSSPVASVKSILDGEYATNAGNFTTGQIRASTAASSRVIGYGDNGTDTVTLRVTLPGDADLNGQVDFNDFLALQANFGQAGTRFDQGNFNYDGATDFNDFLALQANFGQSISGAPVVVTSSQVAAMTAFATNPVPEPAALSLIGFSAMTMLRRRRVR